MISYLFCYIFLSILLKLFCTTGSGEDEEVVDGEFSAFQEPKAFNDDDGDDDFGDFGDAGTGKILIFKKHYMDTKIEIQRW